MRSGSQRFTEWTLWDTIASVALNVLVVGVLVLVNSDASDSTVNAVAGVLVIGGLVSAIGGLILRRARGGLGGHRYADSAAALAQLSENYTLSSDQLAVALTALGALLPLIRAWHPSTGSELWAAAACLVVAIILAPTVTSAWGVFRLIRDPSQLEPAPLVEEQNGPPA